MRVPSNMTEAEVLATIDKVVAKLAPKYRFPGYDIEDIKQQGRIFAIKGLEAYDENRPLENFLYSHIKNRLINFKRDNYCRNDSPCHLCHNAIDGETAHTDGKLCSKYIAWQERNVTKRNIISPLDITNICDEKEPTTRTESSVVEDVERAELLRIIDERLPVELRATYLQMMHGASVPKPKRLEVEKAILEIFGEDNAGD